MKESHDSSQRRDVGGTQPPGEKRAPKPSLLSDRDAYREKLEVEPSFSVGIRDFSKEDPITLKFTDEVTVQALLSEHLARMVEEVKHMKQYQPRVIAEIRSQSITNGEDIEKQVGRRLDKKITAFVKDLLEKKNGDKFTVHRQVQDVEDFLQEWRDGRADFQV